MIQLLNVKAGDLFYHSVIPLFGKCDDYEQFISIGGRQWKIENNYFKVCYFLNKESFQELKFNNEIFSKGIC